MYEGYCNSAERKNVGSEASTHDHDLRRKAEQLAEDAVKRANVFTNPEKLQQCQRHVGN